MRRKQREALPPKLLMLQLIQQMCGALLPSSFNALLDPCQKGDPCSHAVLSQVASASLLPTMRILAICKCLRMGEMRKIQSYYGKFSCISSIVLQL